MSIDFQLMDSGWDKILFDAMRADHSSLQIICPFIKRNAIIKLLDIGKPKQMRIITRFNLDEFCQGVSDISALRYLIKYGQIRGVKNLHAKLYLFGAKRVVVTSANLTNSALSKNHEFGFVAENSNIIDSSQNYFEDLWKKAGDNLTPEKLEEWDERIKSHLAKGTCSLRVTELGDEGTEIGVPTALTVLPNRLVDAPQAIVKFSGTSEKRAERDMPIIEGIDTGGYHWACSYPKNKALLRDVQEDALIFIGRMVKRPNDIIVHGRAIAMQYKPGRDDATPADIKRRPWKEDWPYYVRVHHPEFLAGILANGISLNRLMDELGSQAFTSTKENVTKGSGNTDPHKAYLQRAAVELSPEGAAWMNEKLEEAFAKYGKLGPEELEKLDWPELPT